MPAEKCLLVILGNEIEFRMVRDVPLTGTKIEDEYFDLVEFGSKDYTFDWLIDKHENVIGVSFFNQDLLPVIGGFKEYQNLKSDKTGTWTNIYFSHNTEIDPEQPVAQQNLNTLLLRSDKSRLALTFPVYDYDLKPNSKKSIDEMFVLAEDAN